MIQTWEYIPEDDLKREVSKEILEWLHRQNKVNLLFLLIEDLLQLAVQRIAE